MKAIGKFFRDNGLYTMIANNSIHTNPPLCITEAQLGRGLRDHRPGARHRRPGGHGLAAGDGAAAAAIGRASGPIRRPRAVARAGDRGRLADASARGSLGTSSSSCSLVLWEGAKSRRRPVADPVALPGRDRRPLEPAVPLAVRERPEPAHVWDIVSRSASRSSAAPTRRSRSSSSAPRCYTWREAASGSSLGAVLGLGLATIFVHSRLLERAFVPYVVASQTIPIIALAPMIVFAFGPGVGGGRGHRRRT